MIIIYNKFLETDQFKKDQNYIVNKGRETQSEAKTIKGELNGLALQLDELIEKYNIRKNGGGGLRALIGRSPEILLKDIDRNKSKTINLNELLEEKRVKIKIILRKIMILMNI